MLIKLAGKYSLFRIFKLGQVGRQKYINENVAIKATSDFYTFFYMIFDNFHVNFFKVVPVLLGRVFSWSYRCNESSKTTAKS